MFCSVVTLRERSYAYLEEDAAVDKIGFVLMGEKANTWIFVSEQCML